MEYGPPETLFGLWYYPWLNRFFDEDGEPIHDLHEWLEPWQIDKWKRTYSYGIVETKQGDWIELYYIEPDLGIFVQGEGYEWDNWDMSNRELYLYAVNKD